MRDNDKLQFQREREVPASELQIIANRNSRDQMRARKGKKTIKWNYFSKKKTLSNKIIND
jgi:hypothetical protein